MPSPTLKKIWLYNDDVVASIASILDANANLLWFIKSSLLTQLDMKDQAGNVVAAGGIPAKWVLKSSCDSLVAGNNDGVEHLGGAVYDLAKWVRAAAGVAHSWFVLQNIVSGGYLCFDLSGANDYSFDVAISKSQFLGGTVTNRPVAANELSFLAVVGQNKQGVQNAAPVPAKLHARIDEDGRAFVLRSVNGTGRAEFGCSFQTLRNTMPEDAHNIWFTADFNSAAPGPFDYSRIGGLASSYTLGRTAIAGAFNAVGFTFPATTSGNIFTSFTPTDATDGEFRQADMGLFTNFPYSLRGKMYDWLWTTTTDAGYAQGSLHPVLNPPDDPTYQFIKIGHTLIPGRNSLAF